MPVIWKSCCRHTALDLYEVDYQVFTKQMELVDF